MSKRKVLIPLDGSEFSRQIFSVIHTYLKAENVTLILLHVTTPALLTADAPVYAGALEAGVWTGAYPAQTQQLDQQWAISAQERETYRLACQEELEQSARQLRKQGYEVFTEVHFGDPEERIVAYAKDMGVDMVAMTTHGRTGLGRVLLGSVAEHVLHHLSIPLLFLPAGNA